MFSFNTFPSLKPLNSVSALRQEIPCLCLNLDDIIWYKRTHKPPGMAIDGGDGGADKMSITSRVVIRFNYPPHNPPHIPIYDGHSATFGKEFPRSD